MMFLLLYDNQNDQEFNLKSVKLVNKKTFYYGLLTVKTLSNALESNSPMKLYPLDTRCK